MVSVWLVALGCAAGRPGESDAGSDGIDPTRGTESDTADPTIPGTTDATATSDGADTTTGADTTGQGETPGEPNTGTEGDGSSSTTAGSLCETVLCGEAEVCCDASDECVLEVCLPRCDSGVRCAADQSVCCDAGQACLSDQCTEPTGDCVDAFDCALGEFCEPTLGACFPQFDPVSCELIPDFEDISAMQEWAWTDEEVISIPVVADLDGDGTPEVVVNASHLGGQDWPVGEIVVLDGTTGTQRFRIAHAPASGTFGTQGRSTVGVSDVNGDGLPDIIYAGREVSGRSTVYAVDGTGALLWASHTAAGTAVTFDVENGAPSFANFDGDPEAEIVFGASLIDNDGLVVWNQGGNGAVYGTNFGYTGGISAIADLTGDGHPEIVSGRHAWSVDWDDSVAPPVVTVTQLWDAGAPDGYPAIADADLDGDPEVILVASGTVRILEGATGLLWCGIDPTSAMCVADPALRTQPVAIPGGGRGGPPTVADFDGDGRPEVAAAGGSSYTVYDLYRASEDVVVAAGFPAPSPGQIYPRWTRQTQDESSNATGSSVFDFQGDGAAEVVYADECYMRVYSGLDGEVLLELESSSATIHEYPLVVDADDDGNSEILVVANDSGNNCLEIAGYTERRGVYLYGDAFDRWVGTRRVWTSHAYHVTNATSAGNAPAVELDNWSQPGLNNYRQNVQGEGVFNAPDLTVDLNAELDACADEVLEVVATVRNIGALGVPAGVSASLYQGSDATGVLIGTMPTPSSLLPGAAVQLVWSLPFEAGDPPLDLWVSVDGIDAHTGSVAECVEDNNADALVDVACVFPG
jgi:hypothetical protein